MSTNGKNPDLEILKLIPSFVVDALSRFEGDYQARKYQNQPISVKDHKLHVTVSRILDELYGAGVIDTYRGIKSE